MIVDLGYMPVFPDVRRSKEQGVKLLEEASECREAFENLRKEIEYYEEQFGCEFDKLDPKIETGTKIGDLSAKFVLEAADVLQVIANTLYAFYGKQAEIVLECATANVIEMNKKRGRYEE